MIRCGIDGWLIVIFGLGGENPLTCLVHGALLGLNGGWAILIGLGSREART